MAEKIVKYHAGNRKNSGASKKIKELLKGHHGALGEKKSIDVTDEKKALPDWGDEEFETEEITGADSKAAAKLATPKLQDLLGASKNK